MHDLIYPLLLRLLNTLFWLPPYQDRRWQYKHFSNKIIRLLKLYFSSDQRDFFLQTKEQANAHTPSLRLQSEKRYEIIKTHIFTL